MRRDNVNYVLVGAAVSVALAVLLLTLFSITGRTGDRVVYRTELGNVAGLDVGAPVYYEGFQIGQVSAIQPRREGGRTRYELRLAVREDWPIPEDSLVTRQASGLLASMSIGIREGRSPRMLAPGGTLPSAEGGDVFSAVNDLASELTLLSQQRLRPMVESLSQKIDSIAGTVDASAPALLAEAQRLLAQLNLAAERANQVLDAPNRDALAGTLAAVHDLAGDLQRTRERADRVLDTLGDTVDENRPALQQTVADLQRTVDAVARRIETITRHLESSSRNLDEFSREIRQSPNRLLFSPPPDPVQE